MANIGKTDTEDFYASIGIVVSFIIIVLEVYIAKRMGY